jgi:hypothetical protein
MKPFLILILGGAAVWGLLALPTHYWFSGPSLPLLGLAGLVCLLPGVAALLLFQSFRERSPMEQVAGILVVTAVRLGLTMLGGIASYYSSVLVRQEAVSFLLWALVFYLILLVGETAMIYQRFRLAPVTPANREGIQK